MMDAIHWIIDRAPQTRAVPTGRRASVGQGRSREGTADTERTRVRVRGVSMGSA